MFFPRQQWLRERVSVLRLYFVVLFWKQSVLIFLHCFFLHATGRAKIECRYYALDTYCALYVE